MESVGSTEQKQTNGGCHASFDIENPCTSLVSSMEEELESLSPISSESSIYRVPNPLRHGNERVYTPHIVSIGPLHHGKESLRAMEEKKLRYLKAFIERTNKSMEFYIQVVQDKEARLRGCYSETIQFNSEQFVKIILMDATFIIEVLLRFYLKVARNLNVTVLYKPWVVRDVSADMILVENQLPFFILQDLYDAGEKMQHHQIPASIVELSFYFFKTVVQSLRGTEDHKLELLHFSRIEHFVDLIRYLYIPSKKRDERRLEIITAPSVTELHQVGVKFKVGSSKNLFDIQFNNGIPEIPRFNVGPLSERPIRNIVVFEQCSHLELYMNDYVMLLHRLVSSPKDVDFLVKNGIIGKQSDINEGANHIHNLSRFSRSRLNDFYFASLCEDLNAYYKSSWHQWKANLKQNYFNTPWAIISFFAAVLLLLLTLIQTASSVISIA